jgi:hypothetical protein
VAANTRDVALRTAIIGVTGHIGDSLVPRLVREAVVRPCRALR